MRLPAPSHHAQSQSRADTLTLTTLSRPSPLSHLSRAPPLAASQTERILAAVEGLLCINTSMVVSTGYSNGGIFQFELAQARCSRCTPRAIRTPSLRPSHSPSIVHPSRLTRVTPSLTCLSLPLAWQDERTAHRIPTFTITAGAPHAGFNVGPAVAGTTLVGFYGVADTTIPPLHTPPEELPGASSDTTSSLDTAFYGWCVSLSPCSSPSLSPCTPCI